MAVDWGEIEKQNKNLDKCEDSLIFIIVNRVLEA